MLCFAEHMQVIMKLLKASLQYRIMQFAPAMIDVLCGGAFVRILASQLVKYIGQSQNTNTFGRHKF